MLEIVRAQVAYEAHTVLYGVSLRVAAGEILALLGPSGCGKTTLLRAVAGLEPLVAGEIYVNGEPMTHQPPHRRGLGLMFQDYALFPHMDVRHNVAFGLRMQGVSRRERLSRADDLLQRVGLPGFGGRDTAALSGGEKQRVALARSLAPQPRLLMLDEPLGSLDAALKDRLMLDLRRIIRETGLTAVYVTHDQNEALAIADRIAVMNNGRIEATGTPEDLYRQPTTPFVARFLGLGNVVAVLDARQGHIKTPLGALAGTVPTGTSHILLHPDGLHLIADDGAPGITAEVGERIFAGGRYRYRLLACDDTRLTVYVTADRIQFDTGASVRVQVNPDYIVPLTEAVDTE